MARISLSSSLALYTGGETAVELDVANVRQLFAALGERYPELASQLKTELAVAIDGEIYQDALLQTIEDDSEVFLFPKIAGG
ncbi:ThiS family protein [mine drainage metagenome]|uniref:ThiS family protein n=1 Tax=mine drainage metagenome TaxID=410659 RepID=A0A1J5RCC9_9ZZZZ